LTEWQEEQSETFADSFPFYWWHTTLNKLMWPLANYFTESTRAKLQVLDAWHGANNWLPKYGNQLDDIKLPNR
jgi:hypothetical protein